jgi:hypothetical protein
MLLATTKNACSRETIQLTAKRYKLNENNIDHFQGFFLLAKFLAKCFWKIVNKNIVH